MPKANIVDALVRRDHYYLGDDDQVYFFGEYSARKGFAHSGTNQLIINLKKNPDRRGRPEWRYKEEAIAACSAMLQSSLSMEAVLQARVTFVPMPPSKAKADPMYDDRMLRVALGIDPRLDVRELLVCRQSMQASHKSDSRPKPPELAANMAVDEIWAKVPPTSIILLDDVLTTGAHFVAAKQVLQARFPGVPVVGFFIARRLPETDIFTDIDDFLGPMSKLDVPKH